MGWFSLFNTEYNDLELHVGWVWKLEGSGGQPIPLDGVHVMEIRESLWIIVFLTQFSLTLFFFCWKTRRSGQFACIGQTLQWSLGLGCLVSNMRLHRGQELIAFSCPLGQKPLGFILLHPLVIILCHIVQWKDSGDWWEIFYLNKISPELILVGATGCGLWGSFRKHNSWGHFLNWMVQILLCLWVVKKSRLLVFKLRW